MNNNLIDLNAIQEEKVAFCKQLKAKRLSLNYTQEYMADLLNINVKTYRQIETCHKIANFETIKGLMTFMDFDVAQFENLDGDKLEKLNFTEDKDVDYSKVDDLDFKKMGN